jgi:hypothetical protein
MFTMRCQNASGVRLQGIFVLVLEKRPKVICSFNSRYGQFWTLMGRAEMVPAVDGLLSAKVNRILTSVDTH